MRFGICTSLDNIKILAELGYDYIELGVRPALMPESSDDEFEKVKAKINSSPIKAESFAGFLPAELRVVGDTIDWKRLENYVATAMKRAPQIGGKVIVYGSSGSRNLTEGYPHQRALSQIAEFLNMTADHAEKCNMIVAIEPICKREGNIINTVAEGHEMAKRVNRKSIRLLADLYHVWQENEPLSNIIEASEFLAHIHIAEPVKRKYPGNDNFDFKPFFEALKKAGYDGRASCECGFDDFQRDAATAIKILRWAR